MLVRLKQLLLEVRLYILMISEILRSRDRILSYSSSDLLSKKRDLRSRANIDLRNLIRVSIVF